MGRVDYITYSAQNEIKQIILGKKVDEGGDSKRREITRNIRVSEGEGKRYTRSDVHLDEAERLEEAGQEGAITRMSVGSSLAKETCLHSGQPERESSSAPHRGLVLRLQPFVGVLHTSVGDQRTFAHLWFLELERQRLVLLSASLEHG